MEPETKQATNVNLRDARMADERRLEPVDQSIRPDLSRRSQAASVAISTGVAFLPATLVSSLARLPSRSGL